MKIRAAVSRKGAHFPQIEEVEIDRPQGNEVLVRIVACGICRTDIEAHAGRIKTPRPIVLGHEGAGIVEEVGANVTTLKCGDHVVLSLNACGTCRNCRRGHPTYCSQTMRRNFGGLRPDGTSALSLSGRRLFGRFLGQSAFAEYALVEASDAIAVPRDMPLDQLVPFACSVTTGAGAAFHAFSLGQDDTLAVFGLGAVGLGAVMAARVIGLERIVAIDRIPERLALAGELGATDLVDATAVEPVRAIRAVLPDGVDFSLNTTASPEIFAASLACLAMRGVAGFVTAPDPASAVDPGAIFASGQTLKAILVGDCVPQQFVPQLIAYFRAGRFPVNRLVKTYPFEEIATAFSDFEGARVVKPVLVIPQRH